MRTNYFLILLALKQPGPNVIILLTYVIFVIYYIKIIYTSVDNAVIRNFLYETIERRNSREKVRSR
jgi:hypothetical protein